MKNPNELSKEELVSIVTSIRDLMYLDIVEYKDSLDIVEYKDAYNPDKSLDGADFIEHVGDVLGTYDLRPMDVVSPTCEDKK